MKDDYIFYKLMTWTMALVALISVLSYSSKISELNNQIETQAEYIESQEWREYVELDAEIESVHMNMLEEMRKGNE